eukprot:EG_transcript_21487
MRTAAGRSATLGGWTGAFVERVCCATAVSSTAEVEGGWSHWERMRGSAAGHQRGVSQRAKPNCRLAELRIELEGNKVCAMGMIKPQAEWTQRDTTAVLWSRLFNQQSRQEVDARTGPDSWLHKTGQAKHRLRGLHVAATATLGAKSQLLDNPGFQGTHRGAEWLTAKQTQLPQRHLRSGTVVRGEASEWEQPSGAGQAEGQADSRTAIAVRATGGEWVLLLGQACQESRDGRHKMTVGEKFTLDWKTFGGPNTNKQQMAHLCT